MSPAVTVDLSLLERAKTFMEDADRYAIRYGHGAPEFYRHGYDLIREFGEIIAAAKEGGA